MNVPDRLDQRDMDDRRQVEEESRRSSFDAAAFRAWAPRLFLVGLLTVVAFALFEVVESWREDLSAIQLSQRLSVQLGVPVRIDATHMALSPTPRLLLSNVTLQDGVVLKEVSVNLASKGLGQMFQGRGWSWGEAVVGPVSLTVDQAQALLSLVPKLDNALPHSLSTVRFEMVDFTDAPWLSGHWDAVANKGRDSGYTTIQLSQHNSKGAIHFDVKPMAGLPGAEFQMESHNWLLPIGPHFAVEEAVASGQAYPGRVDFTKFSLGGPFGAMQGQVSAVLDHGWTVDGTLQSEGVDLEALIKQIAPPPAGDDGTQAEASSVLQGTAAITARIEGKGHTLAEAVDAATVAGHVMVRSPKLNGINLGYAATHPGAVSGTSGGSTQFSTLEAMVVATSNATTFRDIRARAGALAAFGEVNMAPNHVLAGHLHVDLGATRVLAPIRVAVRGTITRPEFGR